MSECVNIRSETYTCMYLYIYNVPIKKTTHTAAIHVMVEGIFFPSVVVGMNLISSEPQLLKTTWIPE